ncbi:unnamed protein product [Rotaria magnacalcarata]|uniref:Uncharacterized protein n=1 Tax=Rotaria magnacalcarata TaxID=392030 RepID=A0A816Y7D9_9BILA|nr:unnamed protein product [Rotaria magnacalcarata]CAF2156337.1 unnamed protein product [Rotaria magnacalcarata]
MIGLIIGVFSSADHAHLLQNILDFFQHPDIINGNFNENLAIIIINETLNIGLHQFSFENWYFYRRLARDTGGEYMMFRNAANILTTAVLLALRSEDTLRQAFRHISEENIQMFENNHDNVDEGNQQIENDNDLNFDHGLI